MSERILVAGIGNIFLGDDGFGVEVVRRLLDCRLPEGVEVADFGIRGFDLAYALLDGYDATILVDTTQRGGEPGTLYVIEPDLADSNGPGQAMIETHNINPTEVLSLVAAHGGRLGRLWVVGCEPATFGPDDGGHMGLSPPVLAAVEEAVELVRSLIAEVRAVDGATRAVEPSAVPT